MPRGPAACLLRTDEYELLNLGRAIQQAVLQSVSQFLYVLALYVCFTRLGTLVALDDRVCLGVMGEMHEVAVDVARLLLTNSDHHLADRFLEIGVLARHDLELDEVRRRGRPG